MTNALFIDITATGSSPMYSQLTSVTTAVISDGFYDVKRICISTLEQERLALTELCFEVNAADTVLYNDASVMKYVSECCKQYCLTFSPSDTDYLYNHISELKIDPESVLKSIPSITGELKHFYKDYKNYYYLPAEDIAYHKSVSEFVDRSARVQATARTAYTKKTGTFVPVFSSSGINPDYLFRRSYEDKHTYLPIEYLDLSDSRVLCSYIFCPHTLPDA